MYTIYPKLTDAQVKALIALKGELPMVQSLSLRRRMGENGVNNLSEYMNSRWFTWSRKQRQVFRDNFPERQWEKCVVAWFLEVPPNTGFLDRMTYWLNTPMAGTAIAYALKDQEILIEDNVVTVPKGTGIGFSLRKIHEIKKSANGQLWACTMVMGDPEDFKP